MTIKATALFGLVTGPTAFTPATGRVAGWSESWYSSGTMDSVITKFAIGTDSWCARRAALLPNSAAIIGQRYQDVSPLGLATPEDRVFTGGAAVNDIPQMALHWRVRSTTAVRSVTLRGIPDARVFQGAFALEQAYVTALAMFRLNLRNWQIRAIDRSQQLNRLVSIATDGTFVTEVPHVLLAGQMAQVTRARSTITRSAVSGIYRVGSAGLTSNGGILLSWDRGPTTKGSLRRHVIVYEDVTLNVTQAKISTRKVGRPFGSYHGRQRMLS